MAVATWKELPYLAFFSLFLVLACDELPIEQRPGFHDDGKPTDETAKGGGDNALGADGYDPFRDLGGFELVTVADKLQQGVGFAFAQGRIFIAEKRGVVRVLRDGKLADTVFIDLTAEVNDANDRGLLGITVHPEFPARPYVYLLYAYDPPEVASGVDNAGRDGNGARVSRLLRVEADPATDYMQALPGSGVVLLGTNSTYENIGRPGERNNYEVGSCGARGAYVQDCLPADENSHSIGSVLFGPDGMLYVGNGDGCDYTRQQPACTRALDVDSLSGKILRIDPLTGRGRADNPFADEDLESNRSKVYQLGLRNPFRFAFDTSQNQLYIGDVGWNVWEEINRGGPGANFGWPCYEGGNGNSLPQPAYQDFPRCLELAESGEPVTPALFGYAHEGALGSSVLVGDVYRGTSYPPLYRGALFYTDYNRREIRFLSFDASGNVASSQLAVGEVGYLTQISTDPVSGDLFVMRIGTTAGAPESTLQRLVFKGYGPGPAPGVYTLETTSKPACVQAMVGATSNQGSSNLQTRACLFSIAQHFRLELVQTDLYRLVAEQSGLVVTTVLRTPGDSRLELQTQNGSEQQQFRIYPLGDGYQLISDRSDLCAAAVGESADGPVSMDACADRPAQIFRLTSTTNRPPVFGALSTQVGTVGNAVLLNLEASDPEGHDLTWFASGLPEGLSIDPSRGLIMGQLTKPGVYQVQLRISDGALTASALMYWYVNDDLLPNVTIDTPVEGIRYTPGQLVQFSGRATDHLGVEVPAYRLSWELFAHHNQHIHFGGLPATLGPSGSLLVEDHGDNTALELCLNATDSNERAGRACRLLLPLEVEYTVETVPAGLTVTWEGVARETPFTVQTHVGGKRDLVASLQQSGRSFVSWSDGGAAAHQITVGSAPTTLVATYTP